MSSTFTPNVGLNLQGTGDNPGAWGPILNGDLTLIDQVLGNGLTIPLASTGIALTKSQAAVRYFVLTGTLSANVTVTIPAIGGLWVVDNRTSGAFQVAVTSAPTAIGIFVAQGAKTLIYSDTAAIYNANDAFPSGTSMLFRQSTAPVGWTKQTSSNDVGVRVVTGAISSGGNIPFSTVFSGAGTVGGHAITIAEMPSHSHSVSDPGHAHTTTTTLNNGTNGPGGSGMKFSDTANVTGTSSTGITVLSNGGDGSHNHTIPALAFVDFIIANKA